MGKIYLEEDKKKDVKKIIKKNHKEKWKKKVGGQTYTKKTQSVVKQGNCRRGSDEKTILRSIYKRVGGCGKGMVACETVICHKSKVDLGLLRWKTVYQTPSRCYFNLNQVLVPNYGSHTHPCVGWNDENFIIFYGTTYHQGLSLINKVPMAAHLPSRRRISLLVRITRYIVWVH